MVIIRYCTCLSALLCLIFVGLGSLPVAAQVERGSAASQYPTIIFELQSYLDALGYKVGTVDGAWGPRSQAALDAFRQKNRIGRIGSRPNEEDRSALKVQILGGRQSNSQVSIEPRGRSASYESSDASALVGFSTLQKEYAEFYNQHTKKYTNRGRLPNEKINELVQALNCTPNVKSPETSAGYSSILNNHGQEAANNYLEEAGKSCAYSRVAQYKKSKNDSLALAYGKMLFEEHLVKTDRRNRMVEPLVPIAGHLDVKFETNSYYTSFYCPREIIFKINYAGESSSRERVEDIKSHISDFLGNQKTVFEVSNYKPTCSVQKPESGKLIFEKDGREVGSYSLNLSTLSYYQPYMKGGFVTDVHPGVIAATMKDKFSESNENSASINSRNTFEPEGEYSIPNMLEKVESVYGIVIDIDTNVIRSVTPLSEADKKGFSVGDLFTSVDGAPDAWSIWRSLWSSAHKGSRPLLASAELNGTPRDFVLSSGIIYTKNDYERQFNLADVIEPPAETTFEAEPSSIETLGEYSIYAMVEKLKSVYGIELDPESNRVVSVSLRSMADQAGIQAGDYFMHVRGFTGKDTQGFLWQAAHRGSDAVLALVNMNGTPKEVVLSGDKIVPIDRYSTDFDFVDVFDGYFDRYSGKEINNKHFSNFINGDPSGLPKKYIGLNAITFFQDASRYWYRTNPSEDVLEMYKNLPGDGTLTSICFPYGANKIQFRNVQKKVDTWGNVVSEQTSGLTHGFIYDASIEAFVQENWKEANSTGGASFLIERLGCLTPEYRMLYNQFLNLMQ